MTIFTLSLRRSFCRSARLACVLVLLTAASLASAAQVVDLHSAEVDQPTGSRGLEQAFAAALAQVVVKVTGQRLVAIEARLPLLGDPAAMVEQYRSVAPGRLSVGFDAVALRKALDAAELPVWSEERPATLIWLAVDAGRGQRTIVSAAEEEDQPAAGSGVLQQEQAAARTLLLDAASARGLPVVLPLVDGEDLSRVNFADLWGDFTDPVLEASRRYRADAVLIGRARGADPTSSSVRWSLLLGDQRLDWNGTVASGPEEAADRLAAQLAAGPGAARALLVAVDGVADLATYGKVTRYLSGLSNVELCEVLEVDGQRVVYSLTVRGDANQLMRVIALQRLLQPVDAPLGSVGTDLNYMVIGG